MGSMVEYECVECGYKTKLFTGVSGTSLKYAIPFICEKQKKVVLVNGDRAIDKGPGEHPECPECKNHKLKQRWDYTICPNCSRNNEHEAVGLWD